MSTHVPFGEQIDFATQHGMVVLGQHTGLGSDLPLHKCIGSRIHQTGRIVLVENIQISLSSQIAHQNETLRGVACQNFRYVQPCILHERINFQKRIDRFLFGRRIHHDIGNAVTLHTKITSKTRICACRRQGCQVQSSHSLLATQPLTECFQAFILRCLHLSIPQKTTEIVWRIMAEKPPYCSAKISSGTNSKPSS